MSGNDLDESARPDEWASLDLVYEAALAELEAQPKRWEEADGRLRLLLGFIGIILAGALAATGPAPQNLPILVRAPIGLAVGALLLATCISAFAYRPRDFHRPPDVLALRLNDLTREPAETKLAIIDTLLAAYPSNTRAVNDKLSAYRKALWSMVASIILLSSAIILKLML